MLMSNFIDLLHELSEGQLDFTIPTGVSLFDRMELIGIASKAALNQNFVYFERGNTAVALSRENTVSVMGSTRTNKLGHSGQPRTKINDPISEKLIRNSNTDSIREFFVFVEHVVYTIVKVKFYPKEHYPENASWETHMERVNKLKKEKVLSRADVNVLRRLSSARNEYFHSMKSPTDIKIYDHSILIYGNPDSIKTFDEKIRPTMEKLWKEFDKVQQHQMNWNIFNIVMLGLLSVATFDSKNLDTQ